MNRTRLLIAIAVAAMLMLTACARERAAAPMPKTEPRPQQVVIEEPVAPAQTEETPVREEAQADEPAVVASAGGEQHAVEIKDFAFAPREITVKVGDTVTWTNADGVGHTATADDGSFDTGLLGKGGSGSVTFDTPGTFPYYCTPHPWMKGTVVVE